VRDKQRLATGPKIDSRRELPVEASPIANATLVGEPIGLTGATVANPKHVEDAVQESVEEEETRRPRLCRHTGKIRD